MEKSRRHEDECPKHLSFDGKYFVIFGKTYTIDMSAVRKYCLGDITESGRKCDIEITSGYEMSDDVDKNLVQTSKIIREVKSDNDSQYNLLVWDIVKSFIMNLLESVDGFTFSFSNALAFNTLVKEGILVEITDSWNKL